MATLVSKAQIQGQLVTDAPVVLGVRGFTDPMSLDEPERVERPSGNLSQQERGESGSAAGSLRSHVGNARARGRERHVAGVVLRASSVVDCVVIEPAELKGMPAFDPGQVVSEFPVDAALSVGILTAPAGERVAEVELREVDIAVRPIRDTDALALPSHGIEGSQTKAHRRTLQVSDACDIKNVDRFTARDSVKHRR